MGAADAIYIRKLTIWMLWLAVHQNCMGGKACWVYGGVRRAYGMRLGGIFCCYPAVGNEMVHQDAIRL